MLTRQTTTSPNNKTVIVMVGLPARGKSFIAKSLHQYLHSQIPTKIFNFGSYRRIATKKTTVGKASASFFDPNNKQGTKIRQQCCIEALKDLILWYNTGGQIGILDATNTTLHRRQLIRQFFRNHISKLEYNISILYIESICNDPSLINKNIISVKLKNEDYCTVDADKAVKDFKQRIKMYEKVYVEVSKEEGSYIKIINVASKVESYKVNDSIGCKILDFLMHLYKNANHTQTDNKMEDMGVVNGNVEVNYIYKPDFDNSVNVCDTEQTEQKEQREPVLELILKFVVAQSVFNYIYAELIQYLGKAIGVMILDMICKGIVFSLLMPLFAIYTMQKYTRYQTIDPKYFNDLCLLCLFFFFMTNDATNDCSVCDKRFDNISIL